MKRAIPAFILLVAFSSLAQQQAPRAQKSAAGAYQISGRILNGLNGQPLAGATVSLSPVMNVNVEDRPVARPGRMRGQRDTDDEIPSVVSAPNGSFLFTGLRAGKYNLSAGKRGFLQQLYQQHDEYSVGIVVGPDKDPGELLFTVQPDASLVGRVFDEHNDPVANAQVMLFRHGLQNGRRGLFRTQMVQTNDEGLYKFAHIRAGKFYVVVEGTPWYTRYVGGRLMGFNPGVGRVGVGNAAAFGQAAGGRDPGENPELDVAFPVTFYPGVTDSAGAEAIDLKPGQRESADFTLTAVPSLHVRVATQTNANNQEFAMATMTRQIFDSSDFGNVGTRSMSTSPGVTEISGITAGHYVLQVHVNGPNRGPQPTVVREVDITSDTEIDASDPASGVNVTGTLRFEGPPPTRDIRLVLRRRGPSPPIQLQVGPKGEISSSTPVPPDTYDIFLPGLYQMNQITATGAKLDGQSIQIGSSDVHLNIVAARSSERIQGIVEKADKPVSGAMVVLVPADMDRPLLYRRDESDSDGTFNLNNVTPGKYTLIAIENGWDLEWSKPEVLKPYLAAGTPLEVALDGKYDVKVAVQ